MQPKLSGHVESVKRQSIHLSLFWAGLNYGTTALGKGLYPWNPFLGRMYPIHPDPT